MTEVRTDVVDQLLALCALHRLTRSRHDLAILLWVDGWEVPNSVVVGALCSVLPKQRISRSEQSLDRLDRIAVRLVPRLQRTYRPGRIGAVAFDAAATALPGAYGLLDRVDEEAAAKLERPDPTRDTLQELINRGPAEALAFDAAGHVRARAQGDDALSELAEGAARSLNEGLGRGLWTVASDFEVTLTPQGKQAAQQLSAQLTNRCQKVDSVTASWTGFRATVISTCTADEMRDFLQSQGTDFESAALDLRAAGFAPAPPRTPNSYEDPVISEQWGCVIAIAATFGTFIGAAALMAVPWLGWIWFTVVWSGFATVFLNAATNAIANCTQVMRVTVSRDVWVSRVPVTLPLAAISLGGQMPLTHEPPDAYYITQTKTCSFQYYSNYKHSSFGYNVPLYARYSYC